MNPANAVTTQEAWERRVASCERINRFAGSSRDCSDTTGRKLALPGILYPVDKAVLGILHEVLETGDRAEDFEAEIEIWLRNQECLS